MVIHRNVFKDKHNDRRGNMHVKSLTEAFMINNQEKHQEARN